MRSGSNYSTWWNGGLRTTAYFHNQIGLLTETIGEPTPAEIPYVAAKQMPSADLPNPIAPQPWHFRQSIGYSMTANLAVLDYAARHREELLFNIYRMGKNAIERGSRDSWTPAPRVTRSRERDPALRDPRGYILPADQPDFPTAVRFVDALLKNGVRVERAVAPFTIGARSYPSGSFIVRSAQAFRPHVLDMFEPQDYPNDIPHPGAPPAAPYDNAGWTLAFQMGVRFDRVLDAFDGPFETVTSARPIAGQITGAAPAAGYLFSHHQNDAFAVVNRLLAAGEDVYWLRDRSIGSPDGSGSMYVPARPATHALLRRAAADLGVSFTSVAMPPPGAALKLRPVRIGLWDQYGGSIASGWTRFILERFEFPFERVYAQGLDAGDLARRFDVIVLPDDAVPSNRSRRDDGSGITDLPADYRQTTGTLTWEHTLPQLKQFVADGGTLLLVGEATTIGQRIGAPLSDALLRRERDAVRPLRRDEYFVPGSILRVSVDNTTPLAYGLEREVDVFFDDSPVFRIDSARIEQCRMERCGASVTVPTKVAWFSSRAPLRSGWAWGQEHLEGGVAIADVPFGRGRIAIFGPQITFRAESHGTFKFLFNGIFYGHALPVASVTAVAP
jgi:hypothetical protein